MKYYFFVFSSKGNGHKTKKKIQIGERMEKKIFKSVIKLE